MATIDIYNYRFKFGQYKNMLYREVLTIDPQYIFWCLSNLDDFDLDTQAIKALKDELNKRAKKR